MHGEVVWGTESCSVGFAQIQQAPRAAHCSLRWLSCCWSLSWENQSAVLKVLEGAV